MTARRFLLLLPLRAPGPAFQGSCAAIFFSRPEPASARQRLVCDSETPGYKIVFAMSSTQPAIKTMNYFNETGSITRGHRGSVVSVKGKSKGKGKVKVRKSKANSRNGKCVGKRTEAWYDNKLKESAAFLHIPPAAKNPVNIQRQAALSTHRCKMPHGVCNKKLPPSLDNMFMFIGPKAMRRLVYAAGGSRHSNHVRILLNNSIKHCLTQWCKLINVSNIGSDGELKKTIGLANIRLTAEHLKKRYFNNDFMNSKPFGKQDPDL